jgi:pyruvate/2-oxoglutarate dehydrogenase complex dihydrolipoamide dehydrogenase (E3) component
VLGRSSPSTGHPRPGRDVDGQAVEVAALPKSLVVLGGGAIGCEFAQVFARFGVTVTIIEGSPRFRSRRC